MEQDVYHLHDRTLIIDVVACIENFSISMLAGAEDDVLQESHPGRQPVPLQAAQSNVYLHQRQA